MPVLEKIIVSDYRNIEMQELNFSRSLNCITGNNGAGKTNLIDAVYYLSMTRSAFAVTDRFNSRNSAGHFSISGSYSFENGTTNRYSVSVKEGEKRFKANDRLYDKMSDHIGILPVVMVSPDDISLINESGEERRRFVNMILSQLYREYMVSLQGYNRVLAQRNSMLKTGNPDRSFIEVLDMQLSDKAAYIHGVRSEFMSRLSPRVLSFYQAVTDSDTDVSVRYRSDVSERPLDMILSDTFAKDCVLGHTSRGIHRDEFEFLINGAPLRKYGSQGEKKSFLLALKFAQYAIMKEIYGFPPIMLLDDLFDKLDPDKVSNLLNIVSDDGFGQIFITDCDRGRIRRIASQIPVAKAYFSVDNGVFSYEKD